MGKKASVVITILLVVVALFNLTFFVSDRFFYNINNIPNGEFLFSSMSPAGDYTVKVYHVYAGKTMGDAVRGELVVLATGEIKNIYWQTGENNAFVGWSADTVVSVNQREIDVTTEVYDWRDNFEPSFMPIY